MLAKEQVKKGLKVWYYPVLGGNNKKEGVVIDDVFDICGEPCTFIDSVKSCVSLENLEIR